MDSRTYATRRPPREEGRAWRGHGAGAPCGCTRLRNAGHWEREIEVAAPQVEEGEAEAVKSGADPLELCGHEAQRQRPPVFRLLVAGPRSGHEPPVRVAVGER